MGKLLVVDDEEMLRVCVTAILAASGHSVIEAKDGLEAYEIFQKWRGDISLIIMDIAMPRLSGIEATVMIKTLDPSVKIVLMSGYLPGIPKEAQADAFIPKPFRARELHEVVKKVLGDGRPVPWATAQPQECHG